VYQKSVGKGNVLWTLKHLLSANCSAVFSQMAREIIAFLFRKREKLFAVKENGKPDQPF
jgi:hypothetical protein